MIEGLVEELEENTLARYRFFVPGKPVSANDLYKTSRWGGLWKSKEAKEWADAVGWAAKQAGVRLDPDHSWRVAILYCHHGRKRCDLDNILKINLDGLNGVAWKDDRQICEIFVQPQSVSLTSQAGLLLTLRVVHTEGG